MIHSRLDMRVRDWRASVIDHLPANEIGVFMAAEPAYHAGTTLCRVPLRLLGIRGLLLAVPACNLVDDALHQHNAQMNMAREIRQELGYEIVSRSGAE